LSLEDTEVTDAGLKRLQALKHLQKLYLDGSKATKKGVEEFQQSLPQCRVVF
jgi:hypothetical protein